MKTIAFNKTNIPVTHEVDVLVAGGGLGGVAAAIAAARSGADVALIERNTYLGGVATAGMCCSVYNCLCTDSGEVAVKGIPCEIVEALAVRAGGPGESWKKHRGHIIYDVEQAKLVLGELLENAGVTMLLGMIVCDVIKEGNTLKGVIAAGRNGLEAILAKNVVDSTGDSDVSVLAGVPYVKAMSKQTYVFRIGGVDMDRFVEYFREHPGQYPSKMDINWETEDAIKQYDDNGTFLFPHGGGFQNEIIKTAIEDGILHETVGSHNSICAMQMHGIRNSNVLHVITGYTDLESMDSAELTRAIMDGRRMANHVMKFFKKRMPGFENAFVCAGADDLGIRNSRKAKTEMEFTKEMKTTPSRFDDAVGVGVVECFKVLNKGEGAWSVQVLSDDLFEIPLKTLLPVDVEGLIIGAGRSINGYLRVMVVTMIVGQAAGIAATVAAIDNKTVKNADYTKIVSQLNKLGVTLPK